MNNFFNTIAGKKLTDRDVPRAVKALETIAKELSEIRKLKQKELNITVAEEKEEEEPIDANDYLQRIIRPLTPLIGTRFIVLKDYETDINGDHSGRVFKKGHEIIISQNCGGFLRFEVVGENILGVNISLMNYKKLAGQNIIKLK